MSESSSVKSKGKSKRKIITIEDLPGVGVSTAAKLRAQGYTSIEYIAITPPEQLSQDTGIGKATAEKIVKAAREAIGSFLKFERGDEIFKRYISSPRLTSGCRALDDILGGGFESRAITEIFGPYGSGKTQICHQLAVTVQLPREEGGLEGACLYIDTENSFRPQRIKLIAERFGLDPNEALHNVIRGAAFNSHHQMLLIREARKFIKDENIKLIIVDSLTSNFRSEYVGRETLAVRQQLLNVHMHDLLRLSLAFDLVVVVTNQVMARPDAVFMFEPTIHVGGHIVAHTSTTRISLRSSRDNIRVARVVASPHLPIREAVFKITERGIEDVEET